MLLSKKSTKGKLLIILHQVVMNFGYKNSHIYLKTYVCFSTKMHFLINCRTL